MQTELNETNDQNRQLELTMQLEEEERKLRRRSSGTVRLIGGLYRRNMILPSILEWCLIVLLNSRTEAKLECLCELLTIVGPKMERKTHDEVYNKKYYRDLTPHFQSIQQIVSNKEQSKISNRVHFMLMDVIELRKNNWVPCRSDSNPMKMGQTSQEAIDSDDDKVTIGTESDYHQFWDQKINNIFIVIETSCFESPPPPPPQHQPGMTPLSGQTNLLLNSEEYQSLIDSKCSSENTDGKKCYTRQQIMLLCEAEASQALPKFQDHYSIIRKNSLSNGKSGDGKGEKGRKSDMILVGSSLIKDDVKLHESTNAWKPTFLLGPTDPNDIDVLCKRVRGILNKLTSEKFEPLLEQMRALNIDNNEKLSAVISLVFEKAIDEPNFSQAYAQLCQKLSKPMEEKEENELRSGEKSNKDTKTAVFKKTLLNKCQIEFNTHVANENALREKLMPMHIELNETNDQNRKFELTMQLEEEERKLRRRSVGTVRFIGELYRQNMLLTSIMEWCVMVLLNIRTEEKLECLCKLLTTVGQKMEHKTGDEEYDKKYYRDLTPHFLTMQQIASDKKQSKISSRVRFMLMDVIELRKNKWVPRRSDSNPKKMGQIQKEVMDEHYKTQIQILANMPNSGGMGNSNMRKDNRERNDRGSMPRGGSMSGSGYNNSNKLGRGGNFQDNDGWIQTGGNNSSQQFDPSKFRTTSNIEDIKNTALVTPKSFQWKFNTQPQATTSLTNSFSALKLSDKISEQTKKAIRSTLKNLLTQVQKNQICCYSDFYKTLQFEIYEIDGIDRWALVRDLHNSAMNTSGLTEVKRCFIGTICTYWLESNQITKEDYVQGLSEYITMLANISIYMWKIYEWTSQMISTAFFNNLITLDDLKNTDKKSRAKLLGCLLPYLAYEYGPQYVRDLWKQSDCKWEQFVVDGSVDKFVEQYKLEFVENPRETLPPASNKRHRIYQLVLKDDFSKEEVDKYIKTHVPTINKQSIRFLTRTLIQAACNISTAGHPLEDKFLPRSIEILKGYIGGEQKQDLQLESLYAIELLSNELDHPPGFLHKVFSKLYDDEVVPSNVFKQWETSPNEPMDKRAAVKNLTQFFENVNDDLHLMMIRTILKMDIAD
ncbi:eukaryotic translation initiation factor 4 gamma 3-like [Sitodiplosis mosellana]|uniref:eukaryotic translation initiation factor 4 gamma 3-like n=1 Tax=Sitodiplosis mosellana TaxID=263140 RepID=UPI0024440ECB|nr:eukaryotic translation initiation factor 4 gamma 3-like [Sitodiplosis mosellana]